MERPPLVELPAALAATSGSDGEARWVMGVDGGATKTLAAVLDLEEPAVHLGHGGPSNEDAVGAEEAVAALLGAADEAIERAGIERADLGPAVLAIAGTDTRSIAASVSGARDDSWTVVNDVVAAWAAATGAGPGAAVISGTGSNVFGVGPGGSSWRAGGWGHVLGDEGSGYWLGLESIRAALRDREGSGPATALSEAACRFFARPTVEEVASLVYAKPLTKSEIAAFARETARAAEDGDQAARELYARGARALGDQLAAVVGRTGLADGAASPFPVGLLGSVFKAGEVYVDPLRRVIRQFAPSAQVETVAMAPVGGSLLLAARAAGRSRAVDHGRLERLLESALAR